MGFWNKHKKLRTFLVIVGIIAIIILGYKAYAYTKFLLGYDLTIRLSADKNDFEMMNGQSEDVTFTLEKISKIFCSTECSYQFLDLSTGELLDEDQVQVLPGLNPAWTQEITAPETGEGQKVYAFDISCNNKASSICKSDEIPVKRRTLITLEYSLSQEQKELKDKAEIILGRSYPEFLSINSTFNSISSQAAMLNVSFLIDKEQYNETNSLLTQFGKTITEYESLWKAQDYESITEEDEFNQSVMSLNESLYELIEDTEKNQDEYNSIIDSLLEIEQNISYAKTLSLNESDAEELGVLIAEANIKTQDFLRSISLDEKKDIAESINISRISEFKNQTENETGDYVNETFNLNITKVNINFSVISENTSFNLPEPEKKCCLNNICGKCEIQSKYPILLIHGHNFNDDISADNSINIFDDLQPELEKAGYLNAGELYLYEPVREKSSVLGTINKPVAVRASYYFDFLEKPEGYQSVQIKSENIDTYAIRLRDIIDDLKYETGSDKIIIISHSMGGLVARRYLQIFGNESVDRMILISSPNGGVTGKISTYCDIFGASLECRDMDSESLFINKLNNQASDSVKILNIVGSGCKMDLGEGDGIVLLNNSVLSSKSYEKSFVTDKIIYGNCTSTNFVHNNILDIKEHPELLSLIKDFLSQA